MNDFSGLLEMFSTLQPSNDENAGAVVQQPLSKPNFGTAQPGSNGLPAARKALNNITNKLPKPTTSVKPLGDKPAVSVASEKQGQAKQKVEGRTADLDEIAATYAANGVEKCFGKTWEETQDELQRAEEQEIHDRVKSCIERLVACKPLHYSQEAADSDDELQLEPLSPCALDDFSVPDVDIDLDAIFGTSNCLDLLPWTPQMDEQALWWKQSTCHNTCYTSAGDDALAA